MSNDDLVELIRNEDFYREHRSPQYDRVLEAMGRVDRADFLPEKAILSFTVDALVFPVVANVHDILLDETKTTEERNEALGAMIEGIGELKRSVQVNVANPKDFAYTNQPLPIGYGQSCSQPSMVAFMAYLLELKEGLRVFE